MFLLKASLFAVLCACVYSQHGPTTTPVPILKQINRQNDDGSYSFGYEAADGSFKIETKYPNGDVAGKYGYVDEAGKLREVSYGASSQRGFEPEGTGIMVPPPTLNDPSSHNALTDGQEDDGQYREDPKIYEDPKYNGKSQSRPSFRQYQKAVQPEPIQPQTYQSQNYQQPQTYQSQNYQQPQTYQSQNYQQPQTYQSPNFNTNFQFQSSPLRSNLFSQQSTQNQAPQQFPQSQVYHQQPQFSYQAYTQPQYQNYQNQNYNPFSGHPAQNFDPNTGSYSINFTG